MSVSNRRPLVLWDIDYTLVALGGLGATWYASALNAMGAEMHTKPDFRGRTERAITTDALTAHGIEATETNIRTLWDHLIAFSEESHSALPQLGRALDGAHEALLELHRLGAVQTLVTGNLPEVSYHKLSAFGLQSCLDLAVGGYGTISDQRADLVAHAITAASAKHFPERAEHVVVIGDTPDDVAAALETKAIAVAVATGSYDISELKEAGAHTVLRDLTDLAAVRDAVFQ